MSVPTTTVVLTLAYMTMKFTQHKAVKSQMNQLFHSYDYAPRVGFAEAMLKKIRHSPPNFIKLLMFSDKANFHLY